MLERPTPAPLHIIADGLKGEEYSSDVEAGIREMMGGSSDTDFYELKRSFWKVHSLFGAEGPSQHL